MQPLERSCNLWVLWYFKTINVQKPSKQTCSNSSKRKRIVWKYYTRCEIVSLLFVLLISKLTMFMWTIVPSSVSSVSNDFAFQLDFCFVKYESAYIVNKVTEVKALRVIFLSYVKVGWHSCFVYSENRPPESTISKIMGQ